MSDRKSTRMSLAGLAPRRRGKGFTLVEMLVSIVLLTTLILSAGVAMQASLDSYRVNSDIAHVTHCARGTLDRVLREVREAAAIDQGLTGDSAVAIIHPMASGETVQEKTRYYLTDGLLKLQRYENGVANGDPIVLFGGDSGISVSTFSVSKTTGTDWQDVSCVKSIAVELQIDVDGQQITVSGAARPRRNETY